MRRSAVCPWLLGLVLLALGCTAPAPSGKQSAGGEPPPAQAEEQVRSAFAALQKAVKERNADRLWELLDADSQGDAERAAKAWKGRADDDAKKVQEQLGLGADDVAKLTGRTYLASKHFLGKYRELPDSKITSVSVQGQQATVDYIEEDGDKEKLTFSRDQGPWKVRLPMPTVN